jgi:squalene-hopene/tetraprenyl-beta-curcumene cyclase
MLAATRRTLLHRRVPGGHWEGHLASSALATATAITALAVSRRADAAPASRDELIAGGIRWLLDNRNADGGWGDTPESRSNLSTTALVWAALSYGSSERAVEGSRSAEAWIARVIGSSDPVALATALALRYGKDRTFSVPILTMCAIAGRLGPQERAWDLVPQLPFELAALPQVLFKWLRLPVVSYALPALISMGLARHRRGHRVLAISAGRELAAARVLRVLHTLQPTTGGFLEAVPLTAFVTMTLIAAGDSHHDVARRGIEFLTRSARQDGSWPIDSNLATWVTTLSVNALAAGHGLAHLSDSEREALRHWLLGQQWTREHPYTGAAPGGWAWTDLPGGVPDADDTAGALIALASLAPDDPAANAAAAGGIRWLLDLQNADGGIPTFCRGWGALPFDRSGTDLTAHALRAWAAWYPRLAPGLQRRIHRGAQRAIAFMGRARRPHGAFVPLWFGNEAEPHEENPVYGTSRALLGLAAAKQLQVNGSDELLKHAARWLLAAQNVDGGWGGARDVPPSIEETAVAVHALASVGTHAANSARPAIDRGLMWLARATKHGSEFPPTPIGFYFARLWYWEALYPIIFTAGACEAACRTDGDASCAS